MKHHRYIRLLSLATLLLSAMLVCTLSFCKKKDDEEEKKIKTEEKELCEDTCVFAGDGECDDGGEGSKTNYCGFGKDCTDCGVRIQVEIKK